MIVFSQIKLWYLLNLPVNLLLANTSIFFVFFFIGTSEAGVKVLLQRVAQSMQTQTID